MSKFSVVLDEIKNAFYININEPIGFTTEQLSELQQTLFKQYAGKPMTTQVQKHLEQDIETFLQKPITKKEEEIEYQPVSIPGGTTEYVPVAYKANYETDMSTNTFGLASWTGTNTGLSTAGYFTEQQYANQQQLFFNPHPPENDLALAGNDENDMDPILYSSKSNNWNTPQYIFDWLKPLGPISLDPCANSTSKVPSAIIITPSGGDGLGVSWKTMHEGYVFVNPPYSKDKNNPAGIKTWIDKCVSEWEKNSVEQVLLVPSRTDTKWFQSVVKVASALCFVKGRVDFINADGSGTAAKAPFPSALIYLGKRNIAFCQALDAKGWCVSQ